MPDETNKLVVYAVLFLGATLPLIAGLTAVAVAICVIVVAILGN